MFESLPHRRVALVALAALVALSGAAASAPVTADVSPTEIDRSPASTAEPTSAAENASATITHDGSRLTVSATTHQEIRGETTAEPGTELIVLVEAANGSFSEPERVTVRENGTFAATFDLRGMDPDSEFAVSVRKNGTVIGRETDARVLEPSAVTASSDANTTIDHEGPLVLGAASNQSVQIRSDAPAGTDVTVTLRSTRYNVLKSDEVTVGDDGTGTATFDLSRVEPGASFAVTVRGSDATADGVVVNESATVYRDATFPVSDPASDYVVRGQVVNFATELDVDLAVEGTTHTETVAVDEDGTFAASFDLSSVSSGAEATVEVGGTPRSVSAVVATEDSTVPTAYVLLEPANATILYPEETLLVHPEPGQTVYGTTNLRPGTELAVTAENDQPNSPNAFVRTANATVREDGTFVAELNVTGVEPGTNFSVGVGPGLARMDGRVVNESVTLPTVTTTEPTTKPTTSESAFTTATTTTPGDDDDGHTDGFVPGFGVPAALVALLAAFALARQRGA